MGIRRPETVGGRGGQLRSVRGYGFMGDERDGRPPAEPAGLLFEPRPLGGLGLEAGTQELCVERQDRPAADRGRPVVGTDDVEPPLAPRVA